MAERIVLVVGPESSGTRIITELLSLHPEVKGSENARKHLDALDSFWTALADGRDHDAAKSFPQHDRSGVIVTRRSMPCGDAPGSKARYMAFPNLAGFHSIVRAQGLELFTLVTTRSTAANLGSWVDSRASVDGSVEKAKSQYEAAYREIFDFILTSRCRFSFVSLEAFIHETDSSIRSLYQLLGLSAFEPSVNLHSDVNEERYRWYDSLGSRGSL